jgi:hypothetical protein
VYRKDKEVRGASVQDDPALEAHVQTLDWHVMQDPKEPTKFCIVERYEQESSQQYHLNNPVSAVAYGLVWRGRSLRWTGRYIRGGRF